MELNKEALFNEINTLHKDKIYRICKAYLYDKDQVNDLMQEVMINIWNGLDSFKGHSKITTWLYRVTLNTTITFNRIIKKNRLIYNDEFPDIQLEDVEENENNNKQVNKLMICLQKLKKEERIIMSLVLEELSYQEIAEITGFKANNIGVKINRIKKRLLKIYNNERI